MFNMLGTIAQFERELMLERQREGVVKARLKASTRAEHLQPVPRLLKCDGYERTVLGPARLGNGSELVGPAYIAFWKRQRPLVASNIWTKANATKAVDLVRGGKRPQISSTQYPAALTPLALKSFLFGNKQ